MTQKKYDLLLNYFRPYYTDVDESHGLTHVLSVMNNALAINAKLNLTDRDDLIIIAALSHDMFSFTHRDNHHEMGYDYILCSDGYVFEPLSDEDRKIIAYAVREHRASYKGSYYSVISELISAADRGAPDLPSIIKRIHICSLDTRLRFNTDDMQLTDKSPMEDFYKRTYTHLLTKYGSNGYARYNDVYNLYYKDELTEMQKMIDTLSIENMIKIINN